MRLADVKNETNKDGGGKGQMAAWKVKSLILRSCAASQFIYMPSRSCAMSTIIENCDTLLNLVANV